MSYSHLVSSSEKRMSVDNSGRSTYARSRTITIVRESFAPDTEEITCSIRKDENKFRHQGNLNTLMKVIINLKKDYGEACYYVY
jgi:hypothetical protein